MARQKDRDKATIFDRLKVAFRVLAATGNWRPQSINELDRWIDGIAANGMDGEKALTLTAYFSGVLQISQTMGSLPLTLFKRIGDGKKPYTASKLFYILSKKVNPFLDTYRWKEITQHHAISWGNGYSFIERNGSEEPVGLWPMYPHLMRVAVKDNGVPEYVYTDPRTKEEKKYAWWEIFHLAGFGFDGLTGYSLVTLFRETLSLGLSQEEYEHRFVKTGLSLSGIFKKSGELSPKAHDRLTRDIKRQYSGSSNAGKFMVLEEDMDFTPLSMSLADAEFLASRLYQVAEIARILNMPVYKLKDYSNATYSNVEQLQIEYKTDTIRPWAERWEIAIDTQLLTTRQQKTIFAEFDLNAISRGDMKTQYEAYRAGRYGGFLDANEIRNLIGHNPWSGRAGTVVWMPANMMDANNPAPPATGDTPAVDEKETQEPKE